MDLIWFGLTFQDNPLDVIVATTVGNVSITDSENFRFTKHTPLLAIVILATKLFQDLAQ
jgi:hypothetical protein